MFVGKIGKGETKFRKTRKKAKFVNVCWKVGERRRVLCVVCVCVCVCVCVHVCMYVCVFISNMHTSPSAFDALLAFQLFLCTAYRGGGVVF